MSHPLDWQYPATGPAPPTPVVVSTVPTYLGGLPTPPSTPPRPRATRTTDDYAPCPPTPHFVPSCAYQDEIEWSNTLNSVTSQLTSELDPSTVFEDPLTELTSNDVYDDDLPTPHVSDCLIYARGLYAYPNPILAMIKRASLDLRGLKNQLVDPLACGQPFKLFSLTAGLVPMTGLNKHDEQSFDYYFISDLSLLKAPKRSISHTFSIGTIQALQHDLPNLWNAVYPEPIPPVIIRACDLVGPYNLSRRDDGYAFVVPTEDSIWDTICQRGIDSTFRPINRSATVETDFCHKGDAMYYPQHIVASKFAVNVFVELPDSDSEIGSTPRCEYLGAYVLQVMDRLSISSSIWSDIDPQVQQSVFDRVPHLFERSGHPRLPYVKLCYYHWDPCVIKLAKQSLKIVPASQGIPQCEFDCASIYSEDSSSSDSSDSTDQSYDHDDLLTM
ncbi:hypothetical protein V8E55_011531 [Tylopilus felleus]